MDRRLLTGRVGRDMFGRVFVDECETDEQHMTRAPLPGEERVRCRRYVEELFEDLVGRRGTLQVGRFFQPEDSGSLERSELIDGQRVVVKFKRLREEAVVPSYSTAEAAGMDVAAVAEIVIPPGKCRRIQTGLAVQLPSGWEMQIRPRSGLAATYGVTVLNSPGTIDADYRGEIAVLLLNTSDIAYVVKPGHRVAQLVVKRAPQVVEEEVADLSSTARGGDGFGSTGK